MTDSDAPKPDPAKSASSPSDGSSNLHEAGPAAAEKGLKEPTEASFAPQPGPLNEPQAALDIMTALCQEFGLIDSPAINSPGGSSRPANPKSGQISEPGETAFEIIQRFLFDGPGTPRSGAPKPNFNSAIPDPTHVIAQAAQSPRTTGRTGNSEASAMSSSFFDSTTSSESTSQAQWGVTIINKDGSKTDLQGAVIADDMFRTAMPSLHGNASSDADTPDWTITMAQGYPMSSGRTTAQTAIGARLIADESPESLKSWKLHVGPSADAQSELSVSVPTSVPSQLRALLFDSSAQDDTLPQTSEVPVYSGGPYALHLEQAVGSIPGDAAPNLALIRLIFADRAPIPVQFEYTGTLPSPIVGGNILAGPNYTIPFWVQITPPSEGDKGASLVTLVRYDQETSFNVTAQLLTDTRSCTPTAILTCAAQSDNAACKAASMVSNNNGRLETSLTGVAASPTEDDLATYGFVLPSSTDDTTPAKPASAKTGGTKAGGASSDGSADQDAPASGEDTGSDGSASTKGSSRTTKGSTPNNSTKGGT
ncbi:hypothetical protein [Thalassospira sp. MIT1370]|uniref:hypothetical protein n=1 Tax=unclassified Thalassospira TaxID=2648997 RepID=UPI00399B05A2